MCVCVCERARYRAAFSFDFHPAASDGSLATKEIRGKKERERDGGNRMSEIARVNTERASSAFL